MFPFTVKNAFRSSLSKKLGSELMTKRINIIILLTNAILFACKLKLMDVKYKKVNIFFFGEI
jgi:hypothetical protein